jgi:uroporphyrinogen decarboxylase
LSPGSIDEHKEKDMERMSKKERIQAALTGKDVDRTPVGFWRHWPGDDQHEDSLVEVTLEFQRQYDLDFIKMPVSSTYCVNDYGVKYEYQGSPAGDRVYLERGIIKPEDWSRLKPLNIRKGTYGWYFNALRRVVQNRPEGVPVIATVFNPVTMAFYLAGPETALVHMRQYPDLVKQGLQALIQTCAGFVREIIAEGADGIFLSTQAATFEMMNYQEYQEFGRPGDMEVLKAASGGWFNILHMHGQYPMFSQLADYPVQAINWHDRTTIPDLTAAGKIFPGGLMGGVEQYRLLHFGTPGDVKEQVCDAIRQMNKRRLIVTTGCTYPITVPHLNLVAMRQAVEESAVR